MLLGAICAILNGAAMPLSLVLFGDITDVMIDYGAEQYGAQGITPASNTTFSTSIATQ